MPISSFNGFRLVRERAADQMLYRVLCLAAVEHVGHQHRAIVGRQVDAVARQEVRGALDVMADLKHPRVFEQRPQPVDSHRQGQFANSAEVEGPGRPMPERDVGGEARRERQRDPRQSRAAAGYRARFRPDRHRAGLLCRFDPVVEAFERVDQRVGTRCRKGRNFRHNRFRLLDRHGLRSDREPLDDASLQRAQFHFVEKRKKLFGVCTA